MCACEDAHQEPLKHLGLEHFGPAGLPPFMALCFVPSCSTEVWAAGGLDRRGTPHVTRCLAVTPTESIVLSVLCDIGSSVRGTDHPRTVRHSEPMLSFSTELLAGATARGFSLPPAIPGSKPCVACVHLCDLAATAILLVAMMLCLRMRAPSRLCSAARQSAGRSFADDDCRRRGAHAGAAAAAVRDWLA